MIKEFRGEYAWLSNFAPVRIILEGAEYQSVEHAYMSMKSEDTDWKKYCQLEPSAGEVKRYSKDIILREHWDTIKVSAMEECINQKYDQEPYKHLLLSTGEEYIQEGNWWGDTLF